jgi:hypothetical protein
LRHEVAIAKGIARSAVKKSAFDDFLKSSIFSGGRLQNQFLKLSPVLSRRHAFDFPKTFSKIAGIVKAGLVSNFGEWPIRSGKEVLRGFDFVMEEVLAG